MTINVANVDVTVDTFSVMVARVNELATSMTNRVVTIDNTASGNTSTGNGWVYGVLGSTTLVAGTSLRGGNVSSSANLTITSNTDIYSNTLVRGNLVVSGNVIFNGIYNTFSNSVYFSNTLTILGNTNLSNTLNVTGNTALANTLSVTGNTTLSNTLSVTGNTTLSNTLTILGNTNISNTLNVTGNVAIGGYLQFGNNVTSITKPAGNSTNFTYYNIAVGGNTASNPFWQGFQFGISVHPAAIQNSTPTNVFPIVSQYYSHTNIANPTDLFFYTTGGNSGGVPIGLAFYPYNGYGTQSNGLILSATGNVGISTTLYPNAKLAVIGTANVSGNVIFGENFTVVGNTRLTGIVTITGNTNLSNTLSVTGNTILSNTLNVTGNSYFSNTVVIVGNTNLSNTLTIAGNTLLANTLSVTGNTTLSNTLIILGNTNISNTLNVTGNTNISNTLTIIGNTTLSNALSVTGNTNISNTLNVTGNVAIGGHLQFGNNNPFITKPLGNSSVSSYYSIAIGSNSASNPFWQGFQLSLESNPTPIQNSTPSNVFPRVSHYFSYTNTANPTDLSYNITGGNSGGVPLTINLYPFNGYGTQSNGMTIAPTGNVGISNTSPNAKLAVTGTANVSGNVIFGENFTVVGNTRLTGIVTIIGNTNLSNTLNVTGNTTLSNTLSVTGNTIISGNTNIANTLIVNGNGTFTAIVNVSGNTNIGGRLVVTGNSTYSGDLTVTGTSTAAHFDNVSDRSLKANVHPLELSSYLLGLFDQLTPVSFNWITDNTRSFGLIAQDVEKIIPEIVRDQENGIKTISYIELIPILMIKLRELENKIEILSSNPGRKSKMTKNKKSDISE